MLDTDVRALQQAGGEAMKPTTACKGCGAPITWVKTGDGKWMPCDTDAHRVVTLEGVILDARTPHWVTCPKREDFRRAKAVQHG